MMSAWYLCFALCVPLQQSDFEVVVDRPVPELLTGQQFEQELRRPISVSWENVGVRQMCRRVTEDRQISILLDRRVDPSREVLLDVSNQPVLSVLEQVAQAVDARPSLVSSTIYIGPPTSAASLRTLVHLRRGELFASDAMISPGRRFELTATHTLHWNDLDRPADLVRQLCQQYGLDVTGLELMPHDLWAGATLPDVGAIEALSLILIQFNLTFEWTDSAAGIVIVAAPERVSLEQTYAVRGMSLDQALAKILAQLPDLEIAKQQGKLAVHGSIEEHEAVDALLNPARRPTPVQPAGEPAPLDNQQFTLRIQDVPVRALIRKLQESGIDIRYDAAALKAAGVDLDQRISLDVKQASAAEFFDAIFKPLGVRASIAGTKVALVPQ